MTDQVEPISRPRYRWTYAEMLVSSVLSLVASFVLSIDAWKLASDPNASLSCNISATLNCGKVAVSWQAQLFGFPNAFLGIFAEAVVITVAIAGFLQVRFPRGFLLTAQAVYTLGLIFAYWLFYQSYTQIHALCPWCLTITFATTTVWAAMTRVNLLEGHLPLPSRWRPSIERALAYGVDLGSVLLVWAVLAALIIFRYA